MHLKYLSLLRKQKLAIMSVALMVHSVVVNAQSTAPANTHLIFKADYENRALDSGIPGIIAAKPVAADSMNVDCLKARSGTCSVASKVLPNADYVMAGAHRSESNTMHMAETLYSPGDVFLYRFSVMLAETWLEDSRDSIDSIWQFKRFGSKADMFVAVKGETIVWRITDKKQILLTSHLPRGIWLDFSFMVRWSADNDGVAELTILNAHDNSIRSFIYNGSNMWNSKPKNGYLVWGLYKPGRLKDPSFEGRSVHHDEIYVYRID